MYVSTSSALLSLWNCEELYPGIYHIHVYSVSNEMSVFSISIIYIERAKDIQFLNRLQVNVEAVKYCIIAKRYSYILSGI